MTGFGAQAASEGGVAVRVEARAVNHRHLQVKARLPAEHAHLEGELDAVVREQLERGAVSISVTLERGGTAGVRIDSATAARYRDELEELARTLGLRSDVTLATLLALPGVLASNETQAVREVADKLVLAALRGALAELVAMRAREGAHLYADLRKHAAGIVQVAAKLALRAPKAVKDQQERLRERVAELLSTTPNARNAALEPADLAREIALIADRLDTSEEFARLESHLEQLDKLLDSKKAVGRQLDFLTQEFLREANTIGSKCNDAESQHLVVELKTLIERLREQVQNVE